MLDKYIFLAVVLITLLFLLSGFKKTQNLTGTVKYLQSKVKMNIDLNLYKLAIISVIVLQILCPLIILYHICTKKYQKYAKISVNLLILFTILVTFIFHYPPVGKDYYSFMSNLSTIGGLMLVGHYIK
jgi:uncharacterized membrane protein YphA (DoxX/SURF4 family)